MPVPLVGGGRIMFVGGLSCVHAEKVC